MTPNSRSYITQFSQPDSIIPDQYNSQDWNRYSYARYNPLKYTDPSGHKVTCDVDENCEQSQRLSRFTGAKFWKALIKDEFGINMRDGKADYFWSLKNLQTAYEALNMINDKLNGYLKKLVGGATFTITDGGNKYYGATHLDGSGVTFHVADSGVEIPNTNFFHETGHLLDLRPATKDVFSGSLPDDPSWVKDGYVNSDLLLGKLTQPVQAKYIENESYDSYEYWADAFANYVAGNIKLGDPRGAAMAADVANALNPYINP